MSQDEGAAPQTVAPKNCFVFASPFLLRNAAPGLQ
jgi:hypothetical protein